MSTEPLKSVVVQLAVVLILLPLGSSSELSRCCSGGSRHFRQTSTCSAIRTEGTSIACVRTASICCLRALLDQRCDSGTELAQHEDYCPTNINELGGGLRKECCDCCLLARELAKKKESCTAPIGFSAACLRSFNKCCHKSLDGFTETAKGVTEPGYMLRMGDRCATARCEHLCNDRNGEGFECSCRAGYDLAADGISCVDRDECHGVTGGDSSAEGSGWIPSSPCDPQFEICENLPGGYRCRPSAPDVFIEANHHDIRPIVSNAQNGGRRSTSKSPRSKMLDNYTLKEPNAILEQRQQRCSSGFEPSATTGQCIDVDECLFAGDSVHHRCGEEGANMQCMNSPGSFACACKHGFYWSDAANLCVDVDECLLLVDDCLESQRCLNTPGSFKCLRTLSCGTGYALDSDTELCIDVDECNLGSHDCGPLYQCRNTQGSYRCDPKKCNDGEMINPRTGDCTTIDCPVGYQPQAGQCQDVNECELISRCRAFEECVNTPGSYRCQERGNLCTDGFEMDRDTGFCVDINECTSGSHLCGNLLCINVPGSYKCRCSAGYEFNEATKRCEDVDECRKFAGHVCSVHATCENTLGSFNCHCKTGFKLAADQRNCEDVDECSSGTQRCQQKCINIPGSYQCICDRGFTLGADGITCEDIDECSVWAGSGDDLCMGGCINTPGSYRCQCPQGYEIQPDGRTCKDIDECSKGECQGRDHICVNTLGSFKCHQVQCPTNYVHDKAYKNRCNRVKSLCSTGDQECIRTKAVHISWQYTAIPRHVLISSTRTSITLFTVKGPLADDSLVQFELTLKHAHTGQSSVLPAVRSNFLLQKGEERNSAVIALRDPLDGPQEIHLELVLRLNRDGQFTGKYVANLIIYVSHNVEDGYSCLKQCQSQDAICLGNHTREILYQFRAIPSMKFVRQPIEMDKPFSVEYVIDRANARHFMVEQDRNIGIVKLAEPLRGPRTEIVRLHINTKSRTNVLIAHNVAVIEVHVSRYFF